MMFPSNRVRVLDSTQPVDFRKGHDRFQSFTPVLDGVLGGSSAAGTDGADCVGADVAGAGAVWLKDPSSEPLKSPRHHKNASTIRMRPAAPLIQ